jgi:hypothetical protein
VLRLDGDVLRIDPPVRDDIGQVLGDVRIRGDGITGGHVDIAEGDRFRYGDRHFHSNGFRHDS